MMQDDTLRRQHSNVEKSSRQNFSAPPCCGSGCAVCVLDYWTNDELEPAPQAPVVECGTEPPVEGFKVIMSESEMLSMLEAIEQAQQRARQMIAEIDGDPR
jgi:hypothetical protein